jgi:integrase
VPLKLGHRKGSPHYYLRGTVRGIRIFETTATDDLAVAEAIRIKREAELLDQSVFGLGPTITFSQAAVSYLQAGGEARFLGHFDEAAGRWTLLIGRFAKTPIARIGQDEIDQAAYALYPSASAATRKRQVYVPMAAVLHHAAGKGWMRAPRIKLPKVRQPETKYSTVQRLNKLLPHCSLKLRRVVVFLAYTGARISECLRLDWERDIDLKRRTATLRRTKNMDPRTIHLAMPVVVQLSTVPQASRHGQVFGWKDRQAVNRALKRACKRAGVEYLSTHQQGRHTFAAGLRIHAKRDLRGLMEDGGWKSIQSVMRYMHLVPGESAKAIDQLPMVQNVRTPRAANANSFKKKANLTAC